jgi:VWFA-related protein
MKNRWRSRALAIAVLSVVLYAQDLPYSLKVDVTLVTLDVSVFDSTGQPQAKLMRDRFKIYEDGRLQEVRHFSASDSPYNTLLVVDRSGSMVSTMPFVVRGVNRFISNLRPQDKVSIAAFDESFDVLFPWRGAADEKLKRFQVSARYMGTRFYQAIARIPRELSKVNGRKCVVIYSDGGWISAWVPHDDKGFQEALRAVRSAGVPFHFIAVNEKSSSNTHMEQLANASGGQIHFTRNVDEMMELYDRISREMGVSYTLGYVSDKPKPDGLKRTIDVTVSGSGYRVVQSRQSYTN